ncbi:hypothetical protein CEUSTIGMA_g4978.t1 [Chlamydomonas eustigma]|uniref:Bromo domain-containing protein n=1 Tax=Chlamydomonas eustigma TaxID=1157962 RepID=A0A250X381_9CHLO|nr:hypothetical protein CEUSTIGMA_g4978.t1 [Chlamydomonas eustigma]|eukprot:GAX77534.1 hypothetical protein CEUSTIGMA_g4978.t1 [Chlamydomonas eustigma]
MADSLICKESARIDLNSVLGEITRKVMHECPNANIFKSVVQVSTIRDYLSFVEPLDAAMCLEQILSRTDCCFYSSLEQFRGDFKTLLANAIAYNSLGHGHQAHQAVIDSAQSMLDFCSSELEDKLQDLTLLETRIQDSYKSTSNSGKDDLKTEEELSCHHEEAALSNLEALVNACELAAERDGMREDQAPSVHEGGCRPLGNRTNWVPQTMLGDMFTMQQSWPTDMQVPANLSIHVPKGPAHCVGGGDSSSKYKRHKSKVFIRPNKVVYLPTTFMEENFEAACLPVNCKMIVETNGIVQPEYHNVTIKSVPRQGLSTMYCMTNVLKFQQQYLNWQILNWTRVDSEHIKIQLQGPAGGVRGSSKAEQELCYSPVKSDSKKRLKAVSSRFQAYDAFDDSATGEEVDDGSGEGDHDPAIPSSRPPQRHRSSELRRSPTAAAAGRKERRTSGTSSPSEEGSQQNEAVDAMLNHPGRLSPSNSSGATNRHEMMHMQQQQQLLQQQAAPLAAQGLDPKFQLLPFAQPQFFGAQPQFGLGFPFAMPTFWNMQGAAPSAGAAGEESGVQRNLPPLQLIPPGGVTALPFAFHHLQGNGPSLPAPDSAAVQNHQQAMLLMNQIMSGPSSAGLGGMYGTMPPGMLKVGSVPPLDMSARGPEQAGVAALPNFKGFKMELPVLAPFLNGSRP